MAREGAGDPEPLRTSGGVVEFLADADRPGGWLLLVDRVRQSYVDLDDPTYLDFEYMQWFADVLDELPAGPLAVTHVGGAACTLARYVAATRPGSPQIVVEPDAELVAQVRARLPLPRGARIRIRTVAGAGGYRACVRPVRTCWCSTPSPAAGSQRSSRPPNSSPRSPGCCVRTVCCW